MLFALSALFENDFWKYWPPGAVLIPKYKVPDQRINQ